MNQFCYYHSAILLKQLYKPDRGHQENKNQVISKIFPLNLIKKLNTLLT